MLRLRWTEQATTQLGGIAEYISVASPIYAEQLVDRVVARFDQACEFPQSGRMVPELARSDIRELIERPYRLIYREHPDAIEVLACCMVVRNSGSYRNGSGVPRRAGPAPARRCDPSTGPWCEQRHEHAADSVLLGRDSTAEGVM